MLGSSQSPYHRTFILAVVWLGSPVLLQLKVDFGRKVPITSMTQSSATKGKQLGWILLLNACVQGISRICTLLWKMA